jgi:predicted phage terminase large subunit-like protein
MTLTTAQQAAAERLLDLVGPLRLRYCPLNPTARQEAFLRLQVREALYGGAAGGGKTIALLMGALQYCDVPGYHALIVRISLQELQLPGNLIELSHDWLTATKAAWNGELKQWRFPGRGRTGAGGATLTFGYLADPADVQRYAGSSFSYLGFDELTRFPETHYRRMVRVLRQPTGLNAGAVASDGTRLADVPLRIRSASNPGGPHHEWVKTRFVDPGTRAGGVVFLPSRLVDNPHIDQDTYTATLAELPPAERERLLHGDWEIPDDGELFQRDWFTIIEPHQLPENTAKLRYWDLAASEPTPGNPDPDYTVGLLLELEPKEGVFYIADLVRVRRSAGAVEQLVVATAERDGPDVAIVIEQEAGGAGKALTDRYTRHLLRGYNARADRVTGTKFVRAQPAAAAAGNGLIRIVRSQHTKAILDELSSFPHGRHDDCVDALAGAHQRISRLPQHGSSRTLVPRGRIPTTATILASRTSRSAYGDGSIDQVAAMIGARIYDTRHLNR